MPEGTDDFRLLGHTCRAMLTSSLSARDPHQTPLENPPGQSIAKPCRCDQNVPRAGLAGEVREQDGCDLVSHIRDQSARIRTVRGMTEEDE